MFVYIYICAWGSLLSQNKTERQGIEGDMIIPSHNLTACVKEKRKVTIYDQDSKALVD